MAARFPIEPVGTPPRDVVLEKVHSIAFFVAVPARVLAASILSLSVAKYGAHAAIRLLLLTAAIWLSPIPMITSRAIGGPNHGLIRTCVGLRVGQPADDGRHNVWDDRRRLADGALTVVGAGGTSPRAQGMRDQRKRRGMSTLPREERRHRGSWISQLTPPGRVGHIHAHPPNSN